MNKIIGMTFNKGFGSVALKVAIAATATIGGAALVSSSVFASLTANAFNSSQSVTTGTLKLTQAPSGVSGLTGGFSTVITAMAPGDTVNRFVDVTQSGTLDGASPTLRVADGATPTTLTTDPINGLKVTVMSCTVVYTTITGACSGTEATALAITPANTLLAVQNLSNFTITAGGVSHLKFILFLPAGSEIVSNGVLPVGTVQGVTSNLTWTFNEALRTAVNSVS
jgi:spore coat-associated protein N